MKSLLWWIHVAVHVMQKFKWMWPHEHGSIIVNEQQKKKIQKKGYPECNLRSLFSGFLCVFWPIRLVSLPFPLFLSSENYICFNFNYSSGKKIKNLHKYRTCPVSFVCIGYAPQRTYFCFVWPVFSLFLTLILLLQIYAYRTQFL